MRLGVVAAIQEVAAELHGVRAADQGNVIANFRPAQDGQVGQEDIGP